MKSIRNKNEDPKKLKCNPFVPKNKIENLNEQRAIAQIDYSVYDDHFITGKFIFECGYKLGFKPITISSTCWLYHSFFKHNTTKYEKYLVAVSVLLINGKNSGEPIRIRDVINVAHRALTRNSEPLGIKAYWTKRTSVLSMESIILRALKFEIVHKAPHKYLLHYLTTLQTWVPRDVWERTPICKASFGFLQDFHCSPDVLKYTPEAVSVAAIHLALQVYGVQVPFCPVPSNHHWFTMVVQGLTESHVWKIIEDIIKSYVNDPSTPTLSDEEVDTPEHPK